MAFFQIPTNDSLPWYSFSISLSDTIYTLQLRYNVRMQRWVLSILDPIGTPLLMGLPVLVARDLLSQYRTLTIPAGTLFCLGLTDDRVEPTLSSFALTHGLYYEDTPR